MSERLNLVVDGSQKDRWESYVEGTAHFSTLSELIRTAVEKEIHSEDGAGSVPLELEQELVQVKELLNDDLATTLEQIQGDVRTIREVQEEEDIEDFAKTVFHTLETAPSDGDIEREVGVKAAVEDTTLYEISQRVQSTPKRVAEAIEWLRDNGFPVVSYPLEGNLHYFEEV